MNALLVVALILAGEGSPSDDTRMKVMGKVVSVPDANSVWVYVEERQASYHFTLAGVKTPPAAQARAKSGRDALARLVLGREVQLAFEPVTPGADVQAEVFLQGRSINSIVAQLGVPEHRLARPWLADSPPRRWLAGAGMVLRSFLPGRVQPESRMAN